MHSLIIPRKSGLILPSGYSDADYDRWIKRRAPRGLIVPQWASVGRDTSFQTGAGSDSPATVAGTIAANSGRVLIAIWGSLTNATSLTMEWNGTAMDLIGTVQSVSPQGYLRMYGLKAPDSGNHNLVATWTEGNIWHSHGAISLYNADQTTGWQNNGSDAGISTAPSSTVTSAAGNYAVVGNFSDDPTSIVINEGDSEFIETDLAGVYAFASRASTGLSTVCSWTLGSSVEWCNYKVDVISGEANNKLAWIRA